MPNALANESSPYLRQHAENPVDWLPWGEPALERARERNAPLLVSIGYSACHWCHVMERESFEDDTTARLMNERFVCVKVDREERPDVDALYMEAVQGMTGHGGWPLNVFLTPEGLPFYGGTYFPPQERPGMPSFAQILLAVAEAWSERGEEIRASGERLRERLGGGALLKPTSDPLDESSLETAMDGLRGSYDTVNGGFGGGVGGPRFPQASVIEFLLCRASEDRENHPSPLSGSPLSGSPLSGSPLSGSSLSGSPLSGSPLSGSPLSGSPLSLPGSPLPSELASPADAEAHDHSTHEAQMALYTLRSMAGGGIHDQIGGGFHRYAVDETWTVPHFEKMLYDNALLARAYLHGHRLSGDPELLAVCHDTLDWALREMRGPEGGFYSALDADSDGVEGSFYVWTVAEMESVLGEDADVAICWLGITEQGNFVDPHHPQTGLNVLEDRGPRPDAETRKRIRERLMDARAARTRPGLDDKRLTSWNALMITALAEAGTEPSIPPSDSPLSSAPLEGPDERTSETRPTYLDAAVECAEFVLREMRDPDGKLLRTYSSGEAKIGAYLEDHAFLLEALVALFEATCDERWLSQATVLADETIERFSDTENGGFFSTAADGEQLIARRKELEDSPIPAGGSSAAMGLSRLAQLTGEERYERESARTIALLHTIAPKHPTSFGHMLQAMHWSMAPMRPIACEIPASRPGD